MEYDEQDTCWHLLIQTEGGAVSILKNLDAPTARQAYRQVAPDFMRPRKYINVPEADGLGLRFGSGSFRQLRGSDIKSVSVLGPEGADLDPWRGVEPIIVDLAKRA